MDVVWAGFGKFDAHTNMVVTCASIEALSSSRARLATEKHKVESVGILHEFWESDLKVFPELVDFRCRFAPFGNLHVKSYGIDPRLQIFRIGGPEVELLIAVF